MKWRAGDTAASYHVRRQETFLKCGGVFYPASGAPRGRWHVVAGYQQFPPGHVLHGQGSCSLHDVAGRLRTFATYQAAKKAADAFMGEGAL